jgi:pyridoxal phosphate enzyme (YggS family)
MGQRDFGENYLQEALGKIAAFEDRGTACWHFIGALQSNKTRAVAEHFDWVHTVDRLKIARRLSAQRPGSMAPLQICLQVNLDDEAQKAGVEPESVAALAAAVAKLPGLRLRGLMCLPRPRPDLEAQREPFRRLRRLRDALAADGLDLDVLSMGMSDDLEAAVLEGSTLLRVGSAIFGPRPG